MMTIPKCPRGCFDKETYVQRWPDSDIPPHSMAYICTACGVTFFIRITTNKD